MSTRRLLLPLYLLTLSGALVSSELVLESGYSISTVLDFNKPLPSGGINGHGVHPFALHPLNRSPNLLLLLDSTNSSFYSLELPVSQGAESGLRLLSGKRTAGFADGDAISAMFNRPRSFTVDNNDNVYVADRINHVIRKINGFSARVNLPSRCPELVRLLPTLPKGARLLSGLERRSHIAALLSETTNTTAVASYLLLCLTTTIAGGYSKKAGHTDGPAQNATFSENFDILFMPKMCSLLISDRGSRMIRQMNLKPEDCVEKPLSSQGLGAISVSAIAVLALLCGLTLGFMARPFLISSSSEASMSHCIPRLWNHIQISRRKPALMFCSGIRSVVASSKTLHLLSFRLINFSLGYMRVVFRNIRLERLVHGKEPVLLLDADFVTDEMKDLISFEEENSVLDLSSSANQVETEEASGRNLHEAEDESNLNEKIDNMLVTNLQDFTASSKEQSLVNRRRNGVHDL
ncbi:hypothetical protein MA16_Dca012054 [Dendrobium catenatum]|uniref:Uncharacterized protein n=1 Tax=Dendrobium catenatum TaxID=906689 RepID=A0A2I0WW27_9ASPA|nr:hypothetical protein MA16_Dca012054 [Dendrobium catenatum]